MGKIIEQACGSCYYPPLSPACSMCSEGAKMVLLITGTCPSTCFYCPLSFEKGGTDRIFADEWELQNEKDIEKLFLEAALIEAKGAGITGGDPLLVWKRVESYIHMLKEEFGDTFHIHLYTSGLKNAEFIPNLVAAGLDEIRFHPLPKIWKTIDKNPLAQVIQQALRLDVDVALEIPSIPDNEDDLFSLVSWGADHGISWVNINELEFSERNTNALHNKGYMVKNDISAAVKGSQDVAYDVIQKAVDHHLDIGIHYCSSSFKDAIQLHNRILRRAQNIVQSFEIITEEGTILKGVIYSSKQSLPSLLDTLRNTYDIPEERILLNLKKKRIELDLLLLENIAEDYKDDESVTCYLIEEYPTADALEVERIPLPLKNSKRKQ
jgi:pyruvate formate-lyase activating enzyme-like uncharacterized protein